MGGKGGSFGSAQSKPEASLLGAAWCNFCDSYLNYPLIKLLHLQKPGPCQTGLWDLSKKFSLPDFENLTWKGVFLLAQQIKSISSSLTPGVDFTWFMPALPFHAVTCKWSWKKINKLGQFGLIGLALELRNQHPHCPCVCLPATLNVNSLMGIRLH